MLLNLIILVADIVLKIDILNVIHLVFDMQVDSETCPDQISKSKMIKFPSHDVYL